MSTLLNIARMTTATSGTGTITLGSAVASFLTFAQAGATNGMTVAYLIEDGNGTGREVGTGVYTSAGTTLTRTPVNSTNSNNAISLSGTAQVALTALAADITNKTGDTMTGALNWATAVTIASGASVAIGAAISNYVIISGVATVTAFDTISQGAFRWCRCSGALTLTHNATSLILPGGANILAVAGDWFLAVSEGGGNWRVAFYAKTTVTGSGSAVLATSPTFVTNITSPIVTGGTGETSSLTLKATSGVGIDGSNISFKVGSDGATLGAVVSYVGDVTVGPTAIGAGSARGPFAVRSKSGSANSGLFATNDFSEDGNTGSALRVSFGATSGDTYSALTAYSAGAGSVAPLVLNQSGNTKVAGTAVRGTTEGTNHLDIFNGTAPVGTLVNGVSLYSSSGDLYAMNAAGSSQLLTVGGGGTSLLMFKITAVNFNSANTDNAITFTLPAGYTRYVYNAIYISHASQTLTTATCGVFTATGAGGTAVVASGSAITVSTASEDAANNTQSLTLEAGMSTTQSQTDLTVFFRVQTAQGAPATGDVTIQIRPIS